mmetsp:Transcript_71544/g.220863  ORF Transcript_71544/g.220863 Transcript_71544/m.220863 type:complete len:562 (+) Transcript_71544:80-1765(+)
MHRNARPRCRSPSLAAVAPGTQERTQGPGGSAVVGPRSAAPGARASPLKAARPREGGAPHPVRGASSRGGRGGGRRGRRRAAGLGGRAQRPLSAGALGRCAAEAVRGRGDGRAPEPPVLEALDVEDREARAAEGQLQLLVEVAVEEAAVPADIHGAPAHEQRHGLRVEVAHQEVHVALERPLLAQKIEEALHRHVRDGDELVEADAVCLAQLLPVLQLQGLLPGREEGTRGVEDQVEAEGAARPPVAAGVEHAQGLHAALEDLAPPLPVRLPGVVGGQRGDDVHAVPREEVQQPLLAGLQEHREVAAVHDAEPRPRAAVAQSRGALDQRPEAGVQLRGAPGDVQGIHARGGPQEVQAALDHLLRHHLRAERRGLHVAVRAGLVAVEPDVHLQRGARGALELCEAPFPQEAPEGRSPDGRESPGAVVHLLARRHGVGGHGRRALLQVLQGVWDEARPLTPATCPMQLPRRLRRHLREVQVPVLEGAAAPPRHPAADRTAEERCGRANRRQERGKEAVLPKRARKPGQPAPGAEQRRQGQGHLRAARLHGSPPACHAGTCAPC